jgi:glutamyl endopeptidase
MWQATGMQANDRWAKEFNPEFDYGFISIANPALGHQLGWFGFAVVPDNRAINMMVNVAGYPNTGPTGTMWFDSGRIFGADSAFFTYMQQTEAGESGGPVFWYGQDQRIVVAVHAYHSPAGNKGLRVTEAMYKKVQELRGF